MHIHRIFFILFQFPVFIFFCFQKFGVIRILNHQKKSFLIDLCRTQKCGVFILVIHFVFMNFFSNISLLIFLILFDMRLSFLNGKFHSQKTLFKQKTSLKNFFQIFQKQKYMILFLVFIQKKSTILFFMYFVFIYIAAVSIVVSITGKRSISELIENLDTKILEKSFLYLQNFVIPLPTSFSSMFPLISNFCFS